MSRWTTIYWSLASLGGLYAIFISLLLNPWLQRHALYAHRFHTAWWHNPNNPEIFGFAGAFAHLSCSPPMGLVLANSQAEGQVTPFRISTRDGESLYAWHVVPMGLYAREAKLLKERPRGELEAEQFYRTRAFELLRAPDSRLVINFHGVKLAKLFPKNAGHVAQGWRPDSYKSLSTADSTRIHILTFDYRGFGHSTGEPSEANLISDGTAVVEWALNVAQIPPHRIILLGQSLGTAVATAVADRLAATQPGLDFGGVFLCSGFSDIPSLMKTYAIGGIVPILSPLQTYPRLQGMVSSRIVDTWDTAARIERLASESRRLRLRILHARDDFDINFRHADVLFNAVVRGMDDNPQCASVPEPVDLTFNSTEVWRERVASCDGAVDMMQTISRYGGHNRVLASNYAAVAIRNMFEAAKRS